MKGKKLIAAALAAALSLSVLLTGCSKEESASSDDVKVLKVGTQGMPAPFVFVDENNELQGYDIEVLKAVFAKLPQYSLEFEITDISSVFTGLGSGNYDIVVGNFGLNETRLQSFNYSYPYNVTTAVFATRPGEEIHSLIEAAGKVTEISTGDKSAEMIEKWNEEHPGQEIIIQYVDSPQTILQHAVADMIDFMIIDKATFYAYAAVFPFDMVTTDVPEDEQAFLSLTNTTHFVLPRDEEGEKLLAEVNAALVELREDGTLSALSNAIFGWDEAPTAEDYASFDAYLEEFYKTNN